MRSPGPQQPKPEIRTFIMRTLVMTAMILLLGWGAWILPRSRSKAVAVELIDAPKPVSSVSAPVDQKPLAETQDEPDKQHADQSGSKTDKTN